MNQVLKEIKEEGVLTDARILDEDFQHLDHDSNMVKAKVAGTEIEWRRRAYGWRVVLEIQVNGQKKAWISHVEVTERVRKFWEALWAKAMNARHEQYESQRRREHEVFKALLDRAKTAR